MRTLVANDEDITGRVKKNLQNVYNRQKTPETYSKPREGLETSLKPK